MHLVMHFIIIQKENLINNFFLVDNQPKLIQFKVLFFTKLLF